MVRVGWPGVSCRGCTARRTPRSPSQPSPSPRPRTPGSWRGRAASPPEPPNQSVLGAGLDQGLEPGRHPGLGQREEGELGLVLAVLYCTVLYCTCRPDPPSPTPHTPGSVTSNSSLVQAQPQAFQAGFCPNFSPNVVC